jgi:hypothetical protein
MGHGLPSGCRDSADSPPWVMCHSWLRVEKPESVDEELPIALRNHGRTKGARRADRSRIAQGGGAAP